MVFKLCAVEQVKLLSIVFQSLALYDIFLDWKLAHVSLIFKSGSKCEPGIYRLVSLISLPCRKIQSIIKNNILKFLEESDATDVVSYKYYWNIRRMDNVVSIMIWIKCNISQLQEGIWHGVTWKVQGQIKRSWIGWRMRWRIKDFQTGRQMRVRVQGSFSTWANVLSSVPEGSVLGPMLFLTWAISQIL